ncbi:cytochrome P450 CYP736A12-like [Senna tora]|uniref:Cytochrome P450 CYP736A12-like n=1 Tax=Senna tora TaxID=362788 RepID=A0A834WXC8_9FABA|nr:cytochrome P450 CYP736A12-like [Senna tora]
MIWIAVLFVLSLAYLLQWRRNKNKKARKLPPGPRGFPIIGNLHMLGSHPHRDLHRLSQKHGPIMYLRLGFVPTIVVSSPQAAHLFLKTHDLLFASRPPHEAAKYEEFSAARNFFEYMSWGQRNLSFSQYGAYWRNMRKMCTLELLSTTKINTFQAMRKEELDLLIEKILEVAARRDDDDVCVDLSAKVATLSANMSCRMVLGKKYMDEEFDEKGFKGVMQEGMQLGAAPNIADYIPYIGKLDLQGLTPRMKAVAKTFDDFFEKIIDEHVQSQNTDKGKTKDFVDVLLGFVGTEESEYRIERPNIKAIILDMLAGSMDTSATAIEWTLSELMKNPRVIKKVQKELESVVGIERKVEESDLEKLHYLNCVIKESLRIHPVAPLLIPHYSLQDCTVGEYFIPKNSRVIINAWAIMRDPIVWSEADKFWPERFEESSVDVRGHDFELIPFGSGRRGCPGIQLGLTVIRLVVAQLVHCFEWELPRGVMAGDLDMSEEFGLTMPRAKHLFVVPTRYRLLK